MRYSIIALAASATSIYAQQDCASPVTGTIVQPSGQPQVTACANSLGLGETCGSDQQCRNGAQCFGSNAGIIRACGNFNAACDRDDQCAFNVCNAGLCNGFLASSDYPTLTGTSAAPTAPSIIAPTPSSFCPAEGSVGPGGAAGCNIAKQYPSGQRCELVNGCFYLVSDTTSGGSATAPPSSTRTSHASGGSTSSHGATPSSSGSGAGSSSSETSSATPTSAAEQSTSSPTPTDGAAPVVGALSGVGALVAGAVAFIL